MLWPCIASGTFPIWLRLCHVLKSLQKLTWGNISRPPWPPQAYPWAQYHLNKYSTANKNWEPLTTYAKGQVIEMVLSVQFYHKVGSCAVGISTRDGGSLLTVHVSNSSRLSASLFRIMHLAFTSTGAEVSIASDSLYCRVARTKENTVTSTYVGLQPAVHSL